MVDWPIPRGLKMPRGFAYPSQKSHFTFASFFFVSGGILLASGDQTRLHSNGLSQKLRVVSDFTWAESTDISYSSSTQRCSI